MKTCTSCNMLVVDFIELKCPKCGKETIIRCRRCRETGNKYITKCGFIGP